MSIDCIFYVTQEKVYKECFHETSALGLPSWMVLVRFLVRELDPTG